MEAIEITAGSYIAYFGSTESELQERLFSGKDERILKRIPDIDISEYECGEKILHFEQAAIFLNIAAERTMKRFRDEQGAVEPMDIGISGGNVYGSIGTLESISQAIIEKDMKAIRIKNGTNSILCGAISKTGAVQQLKGQNICNCDGDTASLDALIYGVDAINLGQLPYFLVGGTEEYSEILYQKQNKLSDYPFSEGAASFVIGRNLAHPDARIVGTGKSFTSDKNYRNAINRAIKKALACVEETVKIDLVICGKLYEKQEEELLKMVIIDSLQSDEIPYWSSRWIFGDVSGANGAFEIISALQIMKDNELPYNCINIDKSQDINNILVLDYDAEGQSACLLLSKCLGE